MGLSRKLYEQVLLTWMKTEATLPVLDLILSLFTGHNFWNTDCTAPIFYKQLTIIQLDRIWLLKEYHWAEGLKKTKV